MKRTFGLQQRIPYSIGSALVSRFLLPRSSGGRGSVFPRPACTCGPFPMVRPVLPYWLVAG